MSEFVSLPLALAAEQFAKLPGVGIKTAQRLAYFMLNLPEAGEGFCGKHYKGAAEREAVQVLSKFHRA